MCSSIVDFLVQDRIWWSTLICTEVEESDWTGNTLNPIIVGLGRSWPVVGAHVGNWQTPSHVRKANCPRRLSQVGCSTRVSAPQACPSWQAACQTEIYLEQTDSAGGLQSTTPARKTCRTAEIPRQNCQLPNAGVEAWCLAWHFPESRGVGCTTARSGGGLGFSVPRRVWWESRQLVQSGTQSRQRRLAPVCPA